MTFLRSARSRPPAPAKDADRSDLDWLNNVYQGDKMPQFTLRTIVWGC